MVARTANVAAGLLGAQARETAAEFVGLVQGTGAPGHGAVRHAGPECLIAAATHPDVHIVINAMVGAAGLPATLAAPAAGQRPLLSVSRFIPGGCRKSKPIRRAIIGGSTPSIDSCASRTTRVSTSVTPGIARMRAMSESGARLALAKSCAKRAAS